MALNRGSVPTARRASEGDPRFSKLMRPTRRAGSKLIVFAFVIVGLLGVIVLTGVQEASQNRSTTTAQPEAVVGAVAAVRKPLSRAEEAYAQAVLPIHNEVKLTTLRLVSGSIQYSLGNLDRTVLRARVDEARGAYERADALITSLQPPPSMQDIHEKYLRAVRLYRQARDELGLAFVDGRDEHMAAALEQRQEADQILRQVGRELWPNEYVPN